MRATVIIDAPDWLSHEALAEHVRRAIESHSIAHQGKRIQPLTLIEYMMGDGTS